MKITYEHRKNLKFYLKTFYSYYPSERFTIFNFVRFLKKRLRNNKDAWFGVSGETGCLHKNTKLLNHNLNLEQLHKDSQHYLNTLSYDFLNNKVVNSQSKLVNSGVKKTFKIKTDSGNEVIAKKDHKFFILEKNKIVEKELKDLKKGDKLINHEINKIQPQ